MVRFGDVAVGIAPSVLSDCQSQTTTVCSFCPVREPLLPASMAVAIALSVGASVHGADHERYHCCEAAMLASACVSDGAPVPCVPLYDSDVGEPLPLVAPEPMSTVAP